MEHSAPAVARDLRASRLVLGSLAAVIAAIVAVFGHPSVSSSAASSGHLLRSDHRAVLGEADGVVAGSASVFDDDVPAVSNLDPGLLGALRRAARDAEEDGVGIRVNSGWRSPEYQEQLLGEAVSKYGSAEEAARWVATPDTSPHVAGQAVDVGPSDASAWLSRHGAEYGLCQIYGNEAWHYELRSDAVIHGCPHQYADPAHDPRLQR